MSTSKRGSTPARRFITRAACGLALWSGTLGVGSVAPAAGPKPGVRFERIVIDDSFPGAYQVEVADVNGDGKPDVVALGSGTCAWFENPTWKKRVVTGPKQTPGVISSATADIDGDGKAEIAVAYEFSMNLPMKGKLLLARQGKTIDEPWTTEEVASIGSIHRLRWRRLQIGVGAGSVRFGPLPPGKRDAPDTHVSTRFELVIAPIFGPSAMPPKFDQEPAHLSVWTLFPPEEGARPQPRGGIGGALGGLGGAGNSSPPARPLNPREIGTAPVMHAIDVVELDGRPVILSASNLGVTMHSIDFIAGVPIYRSHPLAPGAPGESPKKGASEVHAGKLKDGRRFLTTVEPWHGTDVAIYRQVSGARPLAFGDRTVIDTTLKEGHALWVADVDGDGDDEVFAGYRGPGTSLLMYDFDGNAWNRTVIDANIAAQDLRGGDLDGDGTPDVVAVGGKTHNVVWYRPRKD